MTVSGSSAITCGLISICLLVSQRVSSTGQLPPQWSQHYHEGRIYYYDQRTGATQWEPPSSDLYSQSDVSDTYRVDSDPKSVNDKSTYNEEFNEPLTDDPWDSVNVDDDSDYKATRAPYDYDRGFNDRGGGPEEYSDDEDWSVDKPQPSVHASYGTKRLSKISKTLNSFKSSLGSLKAIIKTKVTKKDVLSTKAIRQNFDSGYDDAQGGYDDPPNSYENKEGVYRDSSGGRRQPDRDEYRTTFQQDRDPIGETGFSRGNQNSDYDRNYDSRNDAGDSRQFDQESRVHSTSKRPIDADQHSATRNEIERRDLEKTKTSLVENRDSSVQKKSAYDIEEERLDTLFTKTENVPKAQHKKISVSSMGRMDNDLWADYDAGEQKVRVKDKGTTISDLSISEGDLEGHLSVKDRIRSLSSGIWSVCGGMVRSVSPIVPGTALTAGRVFAVSLSAAPMRTMLLMTLFLMQDVLLPLLLLGVVVAVRQAVQTITPPSLLFTAREKSTFIIVPSPPDLPTSTAPHSSSLRPMTGESGAGDVTEGGSLWDQAVFIMGKKNDLVKGHSAGTAGSTSTDSDFMKKSSSSSSSSSSRDSGDGGGTGSGGKSLGGSADMQKDSSDHSNLSGNNQFSFPDPTTEGSDPIFSSKFDEDFFSSPGEVIGKSVPRTINFFTESFHGLPALFAALEGRLLGLLKVVKDTANGISKRSAACALLSVIFLTVIVCGVFLPALEKNIGEEIVTHARSKTNTMRVMQSEAIQSSSASAMSRGNDYMFEDENGMEEDEEDDDEDAGMISIMMKKVKKVFSRGKRRSHVSPTVNAEQRSFTYSTGGALGGGGSGVGPRSLGSVYLSGSALSSPLSLMMSVWRGYLCSFYLFLSLLFLSLLAIDEQLKRAISLPYVAALLFSLSEIYLSQPSRGSDILSSEVGSEAGTGSGGGTSGRDVAGAAGMEYYLLLDGMTRSKKSSGSLAKWSLLNAVHDLKSKELKRYLASTSTSTSNSGENTSKDGMKGGRGRGRQGDEGEYVLQNIGRIGATPLVRRVVYTAVLTMLSAYSVLQAIEAAASNRIDFNKIFDNIVMADCSAWTSKALYYFRNINGFESVSVFVCGVFSQLGFTIRQIQEILMDFGLSDSELPPVFTLLRPSLHDSSMSSAEVLSADMGFQAQQVLLCLAMAIGPFLFWTWSFSSSSRALSAVSDMVAVTDALKDRTYDSLFPQLALYKQSDGSSNDRAHRYLEMGALQSPSDPWSTLYSQSQSVDFGSSNTEDAGWTVDGPDKSLGVQLKGLSIARGGKGILEDLTVTFPPNSITVILSAASAGVSTYGSPSQILESIWGEGGRVAFKEFGGNGYGETHTPGSSSSNSNGNIVEQTGGCVWVHGRELEEWSLSALRNRITYLKQGDLDLALPAGLLAGGSEASSNTSKDPLRSSRIQGVTRVGDLFSSLPQGASTIVQRESSAGDIEQFYTLSEGQMRSLSLSRALHSLHKEIILMEAPCDHLSETQERMFFDLLRAEMTQQDPGSLSGSGMGVPEGKVVVLTSSRFGTAVHADRVLVMLDGKIKQEGTYSELISRPGPFRDQLSPHM